MPGDLFLHSMEHRYITIAGRRIGPGEPAFLIAEVAQAHDGSLGMAHAFINAAAGAGADAIKFQTHIAAAESTLEEPFRVRLSGQDATRYDYWRRTEFSPNEWRELAGHAKECGVIFLSSPFSVLAAEMLREIGMAAWKIGSGEYKSTDLLSAVVETGEPILLSTGMSSYDEIESTVRYIRDSGASIALFQCTSKYPTPLEEVGINVIDELRGRFNCPAGLSDHSGTPWPGLAALARGADLLEVHLTFDKRMYGPDVPASLTIEDFKLLSEARDAFERMDRNPVDKNAMAGTLTDLREMFTKSLALRQPLLAGGVLTHELMTAKKPGTGIPLEKLDSVVGRRLKRDVSVDRLLSWEDLEE